MINCGEFCNQFLSINTPFQHQVDIWREVYNSNFPLLLKAPTGSGKTESVLAPFLSQFADNNFHIAPRMIYVLPMRALVNNVTERIKKYASKISPNVSVEIQHGDVPNAPFFIADIVVTTLDQFLYAFARASGQVGHHLDIPAGAIASSLVVFDEAHMYRDGFTFSIMRALMEILHKSRIPFIVMTATMPEKLVQSLFEDKELFKDIQKIAGEMPIKSSIEWDIKDKPIYLNNKVYVPDDVLENILNKKTLIIVNQVKRAQRVYEEIKSRLGLNDSQIVLLHSRFTKEDRRKHEEKAISLIPHKENGKLVIPEGVGIVVSTQVLEAGIDFSAELLLTELAPADSLIQRAGRCARYEGEKGEMIIFPVEEENRGHLPYEKEHLIKTFEWLQKNKQFNIRNFKEVCSFIDETLDYKANDYEARDTLIDLYECVLYADSEPTNIQVRNSKPVTLVVLDLMGKKQKEIEQLVLNTDWKEKIITVDTGIAWSLFKDPEINIPWEIQWKEWKDEKGKIHKVKIIDLLKNKKTKDEEDARIGPFRTYIIESNNYKKDKGIYPDVSFII